MTCKILKLAIRVEQPGILRKMALMQETTANFRYNNCGVAEKAAPEMHFRAGEANEAVWDIALLNTKSNLRDTLAVTSPIKRLRAAKKCNRNFAIMTRWYKISTLLVDFYSLTATFERTLLVNCLRPARLCRIMTA